MKIRKYIILRAQSFIDSKGPMEAIAIIDSAGAEAGTMSREELRATIRRQFRKRAAMSLLDDCQREETRLLNQAWTMKLSCSRAFVARIGKAESSTRRRCQAEIEDVPTS